MPLKKSKVNMVLGAPVHLWDFENGSEFWVFLAGKKAHQFSILLKVNFN